MSVLIAVTRRAVLSICALVLLAAACSDSSGPGNGGGAYFMRFDVNGSRISYTNQSYLSAAFSQASSQYVALIVGFDLATNMSLQVHNNAPITIGAYSGYNLQGSAFVGALIVFQNASGTQFTQGSGSINSNIQVTEVTATTVRGTFTGTLTAQGQPDQVITNGEFFMARSG